MSTVSQPGSRAGLITTLVIFVLLTFVAGALYVSERMDNDKLREAERAAKDDKAIYIGSSEASLPEIEELKRAYKTPAAGGSRRTIVSQLIDQRDEAIKIITGSVKPLSVAKEDNNKARDFVKTKLEKLDIPIDADSLTAALIATASAIPPYVEKLEKEKAASKEAAEKHTAEIAALQAQITAKQDEIKKHTADVDKLRLDLAAAEKLAKDLNESSKTQAQQKINELGEEITKINTQLAAKVQEKETAEKQVKELRNQIKSRRPTVNIAIVRQKDGNITDVINNNGEQIVVIDLAMGDGVMPGLTFEVFDPNGIPKAVKMDEEDKLPQGKASIEVLRVGASGSECRVVRKPISGQMIARGDEIANLVYDRNVRWNFIVYNGDGFDLANQNRFTSAGGEFLKTLVKKWGGKVLDFNIDMNLFDPAKPLRLPIECDFVVMGKEPDPGAKPDPNNAQAVFIYEKKLKEQKAWNAVREAALDLHIPIFDQNRFLYMVGYYDQAKKTLQ